MAELFDLTMPLRPGMPVQPGDPPFVLQQESSHEAQGFEVARVCLGTHTGTHIDAPRHFFADGATLDSFALDRLVGRGVVIDCRATGDDDLSGYLRDGCATSPVGTLSFYGPRGGCSI